MLLQDESKNQSHKKGVSELIGYVLLIVFAVILSAIVFTWLRSYVPQDALDCPDGTSVFIRSAIWDSANSRLEITLKNNGRFDIAGYFAYMSNDSSQDLPTIDLSAYLNESNSGKKFGNSVVFLPGRNSMNPGDVKTNAFNLTSEVGEPYSVRIVPVRFQEEDNKNLFVSCSGARVQQNVGVLCIPASNPTLPGICGTRVCGQAINGTCGSVSCGSCNDGSGCNEDGRCEEIPDNCGNGLPNSGEECDAGAENGAECTPPYDGSCSYCNLLCNSITIQGAHCGDGTIQTTNGEQCDDSNTASGDGCSSSCITEYCGDQIVQSGLGETCDDGNDFDSDACGNDCTSSPSTDCSNNCINYVPVNYDWGYCAAPSTCTSVGGSAPFSGNQYCGAGQGICCCIPPQ